MSKEPLYPHVPKKKGPLYPHTITKPVLAFSLPQTKALIAQELVDSGLTGNALSDAIYDMFKSFQDSDKQGQAFLRQMVTATVWHGTRRREPIEELKRNGFCSYTEKQAGEWLIEAHRRLIEKTSAGPRVTKRLERVKSMILQTVKEPYRGKFSVTGIEEAACGEGPDPFTGTPGTASLSSGWADRNPEFVWDYLHWRGSPIVVDQILTEMFGMPIKAKLRVRVELRQLLNPQDMHLEQRCFTPDEIISIVPCPPKTVKQLEAEIDQMWMPLTKKVVTVKKTEPAGTAYGDRGAQSHLPARYGVFLGDKKVGAILGSERGYRDPSSHWDVITERGRLLRTFYSPDAFRKAEEFALKYNWESEGNY